jgi:hypothetical protein
MRQPVVTPEFPASFMIVNALAGDSPRRIRLPVCLVQANPFLLLFCERRNGDAWNVFSVGVLRVMFQRLLDMPIAAWRIAFSSRRLKTQMRPVTIPIPSFLSL